MIFGFEQKESEKMEFLLKIDFDGKKPMYFWTEHVVKTVNVFVNGNMALQCENLGEEEPCCCGVIYFPRGEHVIRAESEEEIRRVLLTEEAVIEDFELAWENREGQNTFGKPQHRYTQKEAETLKRHGFIFYQTDDCTGANVPSGVPLGGMGAGKLEITPKGILTAFTGNNNQDSPIYRMPGSYFAVQAEWNCHKRACILQTEPTGQWLPPAGEIDAHLEFPEAVLDVKDHSMPCDIRLKAFSPHIPGNSGDSALPCVYFLIEVKNRTAKPITVRTLFSWENLINVGGSMQVPNKGERLLPLMYHTWNASYVWSDRRKNTAERCRCNGNAVCFGAEDSRGNDNSFGEHMIWTEAEDAVAVPYRSLTEDEYDFCEWFKDGCRDTFSPSEKEEFCAGGLIVKKELEPYASEAVRYVLCWYMPDYLDKDGKNYGVAYARRFSDVREVMSYCVANREALYERTAEISRILHRSTLPEYFVRRLLNDRFVVNTNSWFDRAGNFSINEAPSGMGGCLGTLDQRTASQGYYTTFFPELDKQELELFRRCQGEDGLCSHDIGFAAISETSTREMWPDLAAAYLIQVYHCYIRTNDREFLERHWPHMKKALAWACVMDDAECGIPYIKKGRGTTYDNQHWEGINAFIATMHIAALLHGTKTAELCGEEETAVTWREQAEKAQKTRMQYLWDEEKHCFRNAYNFAENIWDYSCFIAALAGDWALEANGIGSPLGCAMMGEAAESITSECVGENGMTDQSGRKDTPAFMQYPLAYLGAASLFGGNRKAAWKLMKVNDRVLTFAPSTHFIQGLTYDYDGTHSGSLPYYMTAPVSWYFLEALAGLVADVPGRILKLDPLWDGDGILPVFTTQAWFSVERCGKQMKLKPEKSVKSCLYSVLKLRGNWASVAVKGIFDGEYTMFTIEYDPGKDELEFWEEENDAEN